MVVTAQIHITLELQHHEARLLYYLLSRLGDDDVDADLGREWEDFRVLLLAKLDEETRLADLQAMSPEMRGSYQRHFPGITLPNRAKD